MIYKIQNEIKEGWIDMALNNSLYDKYNKYIEQVKDVDAKAITMQDFNNDMKKDLEINAQLYQQSDITYGTFFAVNFNLFYAYNVISYNWTEIQKKIASDKMLEEQLHGKIEDIVGTEVSDIEIGMPVNKSNTLNR